MKRIGALALVLAVALSVPFQLPPAAGEGNGPARDEIIWEGDVYLNDTVSILSNQTLVVMPGSTVHIRGVAASCTEGNLPVLEINGSLRAEGTRERPITFVSGEDLDNCSGREAMVIYTRDRGLTSVLSNVRFFGGNLLLSGISASIRDCRFNWTFVDMGDDRSVLENCTFLDSPIYFHTPSTTVIGNCTLTRSGQDEIGIHVESGITVQGCRISGCVFGIEATIGKTADISHNVVTGCMEGVHSMGNLSIRGNSFFGNGVGVNSTVGFDAVVDNIIAGNDVGLVTFGDPQAFLCNTYRTNGTLNKVADIQQKLLVQGDIVDGNGLALRGLASIIDSAGRMVFEGDPAYVILTRYELLPNGSQRTYAPFRAVAYAFHDYYSADFDGSYRANFTLRLESLLPQLAVGNITGPKPGTLPGDEVFLNATVRNIGDVAAGRFAVRLSIDGKTYLDRPVWGLAPGTAVNISFRWTAARGVHGIVITADPQESGPSNFTGEVRETVEWDNNASLRLDIREKPGIVQPSALLMLLIPGTAAAALAISRSRRGNRGQ